MKINAIERALIESAKEEKEKYERKVRVLQKIVNSIAAAESFEEWLHNPRIEGAYGARLQTTKHHLMANDDSDDLLIGVRLSDTKNGMIAEINDQISNYLHVIDRNNERLVYSKQIAERIAKHVSNIEKELAWINKLSIEHKIILSLVGPGGKV